MNGKPKHSDEAGDASASGLDAVVTGPTLEAAATDEEEASADARSARASLLHSLQGSCDAGAIEFHATEPWLAIRRTDRPAAASADAVSSAEPPRTLAWDGV
jgi:hypothetical protein